jgi:hypothetical protein
LGIRLKRHKENGTLIQSVKHVSVEEQTDTKAFVLFSNELAANWHYLDDFEGDGY